MKTSLNLTITIFFTILIISEAQSQEGIAVGIKAGVGYSQYFFQNYVEQEATMVNQMGLVISYRDIKNFAIHAEFMKTQKAFTEIDETYKKKIVLECFEFPLTTSYKIGKRKSGLLVFGGMHISYATKFDSINSGQIMANDSSLVQYSPFNYSNWDYGLQGGLGYQQCIGRSIVSIEIIYSQGLQNLFDRNYKTIYRSLNQNLYLNLVYKFSLTRKKKGN